MATIHCSLPMAVNPSELNFQAEVIHRAIYSRGGVVDNLCTVLLIKRSALFLN